MLALITSSWFFDEVVQHSQASMTTVISLAAMKSPPLVRRPDACRRDESPVR